MATEQPLWRGQTRLTKGTDGSILPDRSRIQEQSLPLPIGTDIVVLSASHYDALVERVEESTDAIRDHAEVCSRFGKPQRLRKLIGEDDV